ncbi:hypothetical protein [Ochrovirga pacifica]|uniref:hypothetical protein n=1 Tax=Ochrovirga pacifica TaxID=1042376 RepID=UPI0002557FB2|nr:hypothetical protein [Ochrovirga pacifica]
MKQNLSNVVVVVVMFLSVGAYAQEQQVSSLLSNYGIGTVFSEATIAEKAQGGLVAVSNNTKEVNSIANPALLGDLKLTSLTVSLQAFSANVETQSVDYQTSSLSISNLSLGVPLGTRGAFSMGLRPHSAVGFETQNTSFYNYADGGVNQFFVGLGYQVVKNLNVGFQFSRYFGKIEKQQVFKGVQKASVQNNNFNVKGISTRVGIQYTYDFSDAIQAVAGAYGILGYDLKAEGSSRFYEAIQSDIKTFSEISGSAIENGINGQEKTPFKTALGLGLGKENNWFAGLSYEFRDAVTYTGNAFNQTASTNISYNYEEASKISLGGYYIPKKYALKNYFNRVAYRAGVKYEKTGLMLNNQSVKDFGITFGLGLPVGRRVSYANFSLELGTLGDFSENKYQENYFNLGVEFSLSDKWFNKRVID